MKKLPFSVFILLLFPFTYFYSVVLLILFITFFLSFDPFWNKSNEERMVKAPIYTLFSKVPPELGTFTSTLGASDARPVIIEQFFAKYHSPLAAYGYKFVETSEKYNLPWELLPAIAMQESNGGKKLPKDNCLNPFGWGIHSTSTLCFSNWETAIDNVAKGLKKYYVDQGLTTTKEIMSKYNPISYNRDGSWGKGVEYFIGEIKNFITEEIK